jgi:uncharacterized protein YndB with AHSA1/START domain
MRDSIVIERDFKAPIDRVFKALTDPEDLVKWHHAGEGWMTPYAELDPRVGGKIKIAYAGPDGKVVFDLVAVISEIDPPKRFAYRMHLDEMIEGDNREVTYDLTEMNGVTHMRLEFDIEHLNDHVLQRQGWSQHYDNLMSILEEQQIHS